jgi:hypothetical protein
MTATGTATGCTATEALVAAAEAVMAAWDRESDGLIDHIADEIPGTVEALDLLRPALHTARMEVAERHSPGLPGMGAT